MTQKEEEDARSALDTVQDVSSAAKRRRAMNFLALAFFWVLSTALVLIGPNDRFFRQVSGGIALLLFITPISSSLVLAGWRDPNDSQPRNIAAAAFFLLAPFILPLAVATGVERLDPVLAVTTLANQETIAEHAAGQSVATMLAFLIGGLAPLLGVFLRMHPMPGVFRTTYLGVAWLISIFGGFSIIAIMGLRVT